MLPHLKPTPTTTCTPSQQSLLHIPAIAAACHIVHSMHARQHTSSAATASCPSPATGPVFGGSHWFAAAAVPPRCSRLGLVCYFLWQVIWRGAAGVDESHHSFLKGSHFCCAGGLRDTT
eukprot:1155430-Pelagomonas_calceolata.AAC.1